MSSALIRYKCILAFSSPFVEDGKVVTLNNSAALDRTGGVVGLPATLHGLTTGDWIWIYGTVNYDGNYQVLAASTTNEIKITATYVSETIPATAVARRLSFGANRLYQVGQIYDFPAAQNDTTHFLADTDQDGIPRRTLQMDLSQPFGIPISHIMSPTGIPLTATGGAGLFKAVVSSNVWNIASETATSGTKTDVAIFRFILPANYVAGQNISFKADCVLTQGSAATDGGSSIDLSVYKQSSGAIGSDLCTTDAQTFAAIGTWYTKTFVVNSAGLSAGDVLNFKITGVVIESAADTLVISIEKVQVLLDIKG